MFLCWRQWASTFLQAVSTRDERHGFPNRPRPSFYRQFIKPDDGGGRPLLSPELFWVPNTRTNGAGFSLPVMQCTQDRPPASFERSSLTWR
jgi:hypothetical protein